MAVAQLWNVRHHAKLAIKMLADYSHPDWGVGDGNLSKWLWAAAGYGCHVIARILFFVICRNGLANQDQDSARRNNVIYGQTGHRVCAA